MLGDRISYVNRCLRTQQGKLLFGPVGRRLFVDYLEAAPGFLGRIDFIHKLNLTELFTVRCSIQRDFTGAAAVWRPETMELAFENGRISFLERKFITIDDCAVSLMEWTNKTAAPMELFLDSAPALCDVQTDKTGLRSIAAPDTGHGFRVGIAVAADCGIGCASLTVGPGERVAFAVCAAAGNLETETMQSLAERARAYATAGEEVLARHLEESERFYRGFPQFASSDRLLNAAWDYRLFLLRHTLAFPDFGLLKGACMYEGRSHKMGREPLNPTGWEFSKLINLSTPLHITDFRWHSDRGMARDMIRNMISNLDENGIFCSAYVDRRLHAYANYGVWAVWLLWEVEQDRDFLAEILPALKKYVRREEKTYGGMDNLQIERTHNRTGKEYQPSYWSFGEYPADPKSPQGKAAVTPLKRVDRSVYHYLNVLGLARLCEALGDGDGQMYLEIAGEIKGNILEKMWDGESGFFYDLHHITDARSDVKNIVGVYPYWAGITSQKHLPGLEKLFDERYFYTGCPFPSVARDCEIYSPMGGWKGNFIKGRDGCVWCGPSWPYTTGIALDAVARQSRENGSRYDGQFAALLRKYALQHFRDHDLSRPYLVEHYHAETGEQLSDDVDYNHSFFMDLIVRHVCGLCVENGSVRVDPLDMGLDWFVLENLHINGAIYCVSFKGDGCTAPEARDLPEGLTVTRNGEVYGS